MGDWIRFTLKLVPKFAKGMTVKAAKILELNLGNQRHEEEQKSTKNWKKSKVNKCNHLTPYLHI